MSPFSAFFCPFSAEKLGFARSNIPRYLQQAIRSLPLSGRRLTSNLGHPARMVNLIPQILAGGAHAALLVSASERIRSTTAALAAPCLGMV
jgi:hypothetical protein